jgi:hypothetical protein
LAIADCRFDREFKVTKSAIGNWQLAIGNRQWFLARRVLSNFAARHGMDEGHRVPAANIP